jgi:hypothetical protein
VFGPRSFGVNPNCWPPNGAIVVLSEGQCEHGVLQDSWKAMGRGWFGVVCVCVCVCGARSSFGECGVFVGLCLCWVCVSVVGWRGDVMG